MPNERTHLAELDRLFVVASREASALGNNWIGPEHFILAILVGAPDSPSAAALSRLGVTHRTFAAGLTAETAAAGTPRSETGRSDEAIAPNPGTHELLGRADGLAAGLAATHVSPEHLLVAYLWDPAASVDLEEHCGVGRAAVLQELGRLGVRVPDAPLPPQPHALGAPVTVPYGELMRVVTALQTRLPHDSGLGFNDDGESRAWVTARREIDLGEHVREILETSDPEQ